MADDDGRYGEADSFDSFYDRPERPQRNRRTLLIVAAVLVIVLGGGGAAAYFGFGGGTGNAAVTALPPAVGSSAAAPTTESTPPPLGQPPGTVRLPGGGTAKLVRKDLDPDGTLPIPTSIDEAAWWGAGLGAPHGAALLSGHINWKGKIGPFKELWQDKAGQQIEIVDTSGRKWVYQVTQALTVSKDRLAAKAEELFGQGGPHRLVLVTCGGEFVGGDEGYNENRILVASLLTRP